MRHVLMNQLLAASLAAAWSVSAMATPKTALNSSRDVSCQTAYQGLYAKGSAEFRVIFGYKDTRPSRFVGDRHERLVFVQRILKPCQVGQHACGFSRDPDNSDLFTKVIPGPKNWPVKVSLHVVHSSVGSDDLTNRADPFQKWQSSYAKNTFLDGLKKADVVLYNGHSRFGGGPDFGPPRLISSGEVDAGYYKGQRPGLQTIRKTLRARASSTASTGSAAKSEVKASSQGLKVLGLFSCASSQHFADELAADTSGGLISSRALIYYADALEKSLAALSGLLEMRCERDFKTLLRTSAPKSGPQLQGFFGKN